MLRRPFFISASGGKATFDKQSTDSKEVNDGLIVEEWVPALLTWKDIEIGDIIGCGSFASVYSVESIESIFLPANEDLEGDSGLNFTDDDCVTSATEDIQDYDLGSDAETTSSGRGVMPSSRYVIKCLKGFLPKDEAVKTENAARALVTEAAILSQLPRHPNIIRMFGMSTSLLHEPQDGFILLERVPVTMEQRLRTWRAEHAAMTADETSLNHLFRRGHLQRTRIAQHERMERYVTAIAEGMHFLHEHHILHRDLKPANIGVGYDGKVRILDLGLARKFIPNKDRKLTSNCGTMRYMAPEVAIPQRRGYGFAADVYSFSMVSWEILTLSKPFYGQAKGREELRNLIHVQNKRPLLRCVASPGLRKLLQAGWSPECKQRPSFREIVNVLQNETLSLSPVKSKLSVSSKQIPSADVL